MQSVRIDKKIIDFIKSIRSKKYNNKTMTMIATEAIFQLCSKSEECFICAVHRDELAGIETGRQSLALRALASGSNKKAKAGWIKVGPDAVKVATSYAGAYGRPLETVFEQALIEFLTMPGQCGECPKHKESPRHG